MAEIWEITDLDTDYIAYFSTKEKALSYMNEVHFLDEFELVRCTPDDTGMFIPDSDSVLYEWNEEKGVYES